MVPTDCGPAGVLKQTAGTHTLGRFTGIVPSKSLGLVVRPPADGELLLTANSLLVRL